MPQNPNNEYRVPENGDFYSQDPIKKEIGDIYSKIGGNVIYVDFQSQPEKNRNPEIENLVKICLDIEDARDKMIARLAA
jgi:hypothetical protein